MVAMEVAASCRPFRKSNSSAVPISSQSAVVAGSSISDLSEVLEQDAADLVRHVLEAVEHLLQVVVDLRPGDEGHRPVLAGPEQGLHALVVDLVRAVLDAGDGLGDGVRAGGVAAK